MKNSSQIFYGCGLIGLIVGVLLWIPAALIQEGFIKSFGPVSGYPAKIHAEQIFSLFLLPTVIALIIERWPTIGLNRPFVIKFSLGILIALLPFSLLANRLPFYALSLLLILIPFYLLLDYRAKSDRGALLLLTIKLALFCGVAGFFLLFSFEVLKLSGFYRVGHLLNGYGLMGLLYLAALMILSERFKLDAPVNRVPSRLVKLLLILFALSFGIDFYLVVVEKIKLSFAYSAGLRAAVLLLLTNLFVPLWKSQLYRRGETLNLILSIVLVLTGSVGVAADYYARTHWAHLFFVGGAVYLLALLAASLPATETGKKRPWLRAGRMIPLLIVVAALTRGLIHLMPDSEYNFHLMYASLTLLIPIVWQISRMKTVVRNGSGSRQ